jgi:DNA polymerase III subunit beta
MKFKIQRDFFANGLQQVLSLVGARASIPVLSNVLIVTEGNSLRLTTTNLDQAIRCELKAEVLTPGGVTLPAKRLATIIRSLPNAEVCVDVNAGQQAKIDSGGSHFKIMGLPQEDFPSVSTQALKHSIVLEQAEFLHMLKHVAYAQSTDENRYLLNGVYFNIEGDKFTLVATDGRRLALFSKEMLTPADHMGQFILPAKTVSELVRILGQGKDLRMSFNERQIAFEIGIRDDAEKDVGLIGSTVLISKAIEGNFPNYKQVIPSQTDQRIKLDRELLLDCVQRAALVTNEKNNSVRVRVGNNLMEIMSSSPEVGESHESLAIEYDGPQVQVGFNPQFLVEPLRALTRDEIFFEFKDELSPGVFKTTEPFLCVVMPLRS